MTVGAHGLKSQRDTSTGHHCSPRNQFRWNRKPRKRNSWSRVMQCVLKALPERENKKKEPGVIRAFLLANGAASATPTLNSFSLLVCLFNSVQQKQKVCPSPVLIDLPARRDACDFCYPLLVIARRSNVTDHPTHRDTRTKYRPSLTGDTAAVLLTSRCHSRGQRLCLGEWP